LDHYLPLSLADPAIGFLPVLDFPQDRELAEKKTLQVYLL
jgi:hypothetical protein